MKPNNLIIVAVSLFFINTLYASSPVNVKQFINKKDWNFTENKGQLKSPEGELGGVKYYGHQGGVYLYCKPGMLSFVFTKVENQPQQISEATGQPSGFPLSRKGAGGFGPRPPLPALSSSVSASRTDLILLNSNPDAQILASDQQEYYENYYTTGDADHGITNVHTFKTVTYKDVYPHIDMVLQTKEQGMEYSFVVHPGGDINDIKLKWNSLGSVVMNNAGGLIYHLPNAQQQFTEAAPMSFADNQLVKSRFQLKKNVIAFSVDKYDGSKTLVIDPKIEWGTFYGTIKGSDETLMNSIMVDSGKSIYVTGASNANGIATSGAYQTTFQLDFYDDQEVFLLKFDSSGNRKWATFFGDDNTRSALGLVTDKKGGIYISGGTYSSTGIATSGAFQTSMGSGYLMKFNYKGYRVWGTYYGYQNDGPIKAMCTDTFGNLLVAGTTGYPAGINFYPASILTTKGSYYPIYENGWDFISYIAKFDSSGSRIWGTYYPAIEGGKSITIRAITCDASGNVYVASDDDGTNRQNIGIGKISSDGSKRLWTRYYDDPYSNFGYGTAIGFDNNTSSVYITGYTTLKSGIATSNGRIQTNSGQQGFLMKFDTVGKKLWGTYIGKYNGTTLSTALTIDSHGDIYCAGSTSSDSGISTSGSYNSKMRHSFGNDGNYIFLNKFSPCGGLIYGTYLGMEGSESNPPQICGIALDGSNRVVMDGDDYDSSLATKNAIQPYPFGESGFILTFSALPTCICGDYTIGAHNATYKNFTSAIADLKQTGVCGPTNFFVKPGIYTEHFTVPDIPGTGSGTPVTFNSNNGATINYPSSSNADSNYIIKFSGSSYVNFNTLTFTRSGKSNFTTCILSDSSNNIGFKKDIFSGTYTTDTTINSSLIALNNTTDSSFNVDSCTLLNGSYGIWLEGKSANAMGLNNTIDHDTFTSFSIAAINAQYQEGIQITNNLIYDSSLNIHSGIILRNCNNYMSAITGNKIALFTAGNAILIQGEGFSNSKYFLIANNFVSVNGDSSSSAIDLSNNRNIYLYYNSINALGNSNALAVSSSIKTDSVKIINNILSGEKGFCVLSNGNYNMSSDYDDFYNSGKVLFSIGNTIYTNLPNFQKTGINLHSLSTRPYYKSLSDLHIKNSNLLGKGIPLASINKDIDNNVRNSLKPDIGAVEFKAYNTDAALFSAIGDSIFTCAGEDNVDILLTNTGLDTLKSEAITWYVNNIQQGSTLNLSLILYPGQSDTLRLGIIKVMAGNSYSVIAVGSKPNGIKDSFPGNDSAMFVISGYSKPPLYQGKDTAICFGNNTKLNGPLTKGVYITWSSSPTGFSSTGAVVTVAPKISTIYYRIASNIYTGCVDTDSVKIFVKPLPSAKTQSNKTICAGIFTTLGDSAVAGSNYNWTSSPIGFNSTNSNPMDSPLATTVYYLTETNKFGCIKTDSVTISVNPNPIANLSYTSVCPSDSTPFSDTSASANSYSWSFGDGGTSSLQNLKHLYTSNGTYNVNLKVSNSFGCTDSISQKITISDCVWPGDANDDKVVDMKDFLMLGIAYGDTGLPRPSASLTWTGQPCPEWKDTIPSGINAKHADCNGDSIVNYGDTTAISLNYGQSHSKSSPLIQGNPSDPGFIITPLLDSVSIGKIFQASISIGSQKNPVQNLYGMAFSIFADPALFETNKASIKVIPSFFGTDSVDLMDMKINNISNGTIDLGFTRIDHTNASGYGTFAILSIPVKATIPQKNIKTSLSVSNNTQISYNGKNIPLYFSSDSAVVTQHTTGVNPASQFLSGINIYPNPFSSSSSVQYTLLKTSKVTISLFDMTGKEMGMVLEANQKSGQYTFDIQSDKYHLSPGVYLLKFTTDDGYVTRQLVKF